MKPRCVSIEHKILAEAEHLSRQPCRRTGAEYPVANVTELCSFSSVQQLPLHSNTAELLLSADPGFVISFHWSVFDTNANPPDLQFAVTILFQKSSADIGAGKQKTEQERELLSLCYQLLASKRPVKILISS